MSNLTRSLPVVSSDNTSAHFSRRLAGDPNGLTSGSSAMPSLTTRKTLILTWQVHTGCSEYQRYNTGTSIHSKCKRIEDFLVQAETPSFFFFFFFLQRNSEHVCKYDIKPSIICFFGNSFVLSRNFPPCLLFTSTMK